MSLSQKIAQNTAIQAAGKIAGMVLSLISAGMVLRYLGGAGFGKYTGIVSFLQVFGIIMDFGLYIILIKKMAETTEEARQDVNYIFSLRIISGIIFLSIAPLAAWIIGRFQPFYSSEVIAGIALTTLFFFCISMNQLLSAVFQKALRTDWIALAELTGKVVLLVATALFIALDLSLLWILAALVLSSAVNCCITFAASRAYVKLRFAVNWRAYKQLITEAWPTAISIALALLYFKGDSVLLTFYADPEVIGWYGAPYKILEVLVTFPAMFAGLALPVMTAAWKARESERFQRVLQKSFNGLASIAVPMIFGTLVLAPQMITILAGNDFVPSIPILRILILATAAIFFGTLFGYLVVAVEQQRRMVWGYAFVALTSLAAYLVVIPRFSIVGTAWVTVYSEVAIALISLWLVVRTTHARVHIRTAVKIITASVVMYAVVGYCADFIHPWTATFSTSTWGAVAELALLVPAGALVYGVCFYAFGAARDVELSAIIRSQKSHV